MNAAPTSPSTSQLKTIVTLFVVLRVTILLLYTPQGLLNAYTDYQHYYRTAQFADQGFYPFVNMWYEYPPVTTYLSEAVYGLARSIFPPGDLNSYTYQIYARLLAATFLCFETGVLILIHRLATRLWQVERANWLGWVYASLSLPLFFWNASQNSVVTFFTLLAMERFLQARYAMSAAALGLGIAAKFTPIFLVGSVARFLLPDVRQIVKYGILLGFVVAAVFLPFALLGGGPWVIASLVVLGRLGSWATPWALLDGNWNPGDAGPLATRFQLDAIDRLPGNPALISPLISLLVFGAIYLWLFTRPIDAPARSPRHFLWFTLLTAILFVLWSKGWSPQWATLLIPLFLLSLPDWRGLGLVLALTGIIFVEWPLSDALHSRGLLAASIIARTLLFIFSAVLTARQLWPRNNAPDRFAAP